MLFLLLSLLVTLVPVSVAADEAVVFISDDGRDSNDGKTPEKAVCTFDTAYSLLPDNGGTIVFCGEVTLSDSLMDQYYHAPEKSGTITFTCVWDGVDYRVTNGAGLRYDAWYFMNAPHVIENFQFLIARSTQLFCCNGYELYIGNDVLTTQAGASNYIGITAGRNDDTVQTAELGGKLTINSGSWQMIRGGTRNNTGLDCQNEGGPVITINGGTFYDTLFGGGDGTIQGDVTVIINGGTFKKGITPVNLGDVKGNVSITINDGDFTASSSMSLFRSGSSAVGALGGTGKFVINGGTFKEGFTLIGDNDFNKASQGTVLDMTNWATKPAGFTHSGWSTVIETAVAPVTEPTTEPATEPTTEPLKAPDSYGILADFNPEAIVEDLSGVIGDTTRTAISGSIGIPALYAHANAATDEIVVKIVEENGEKFLRYTNNGSYTYSQFVIDFDPELFTTAEEYYVTTTFRLSEGFASKDSNGRAVLSRMFASGQKNNVIVTADQLAANDYTEWTTVTYAVDPGDPATGLSTILFANGGDYIDIKDIKVYAASAANTTEPTTDPIEGGEVTPPTGDYTFVLLAVCILAAVSVAVLATKKVRN